MFQAITQLLPDINFVPIRHENEEQRLSYVSLAGRSFMRSVVIGGGTLINESSLHIVQSLTREGHNLYSFGTGVGSWGYGQEDGPISTGWRDVLKHFSKITVRGPLSQKRLCSLGIGDVRVIGDPALYYARSEVLSRTDTPSLALNIVEWWRDEYAVPDAPWLEELVGALRKLVQMGWRVIPIAMDGNDIQPLQQILDRLANNEVIVLAETPRQLLSILERCWLTVTMRLHLAVFASCVGVPSLMLGYREKHLDFMQSMGIADLHVPIYTVSSGLIDETLGHASLLGPLVRSDILSTALRWRQMLTDYAAELRLLVH